MRSNYVLAELGGESGIVCWICIFNLNCWNDLFPNDYLCLVGHYFEVMMFWLNYGVKVDLFSGFAFLTLIVEMICFPITVSA